ncbi:hypothetical protein KFE98_19990 [bacterium SCSIO 12741]|nr:hypothetical protein KFE98_19990 [bacterium SCSIO 12741]
MKTIPTRAADVSLDDQGIIHMTFTQNSKITLSDAQEIFRVRRELEPNRSKQLLLLDMRATPGANREARFYSKKKEVIDTTQAMAMIVENYSSQILGNFFLGFIRGDYPVRLFTDEESAVKWLKSKE